MDLERKKWTVSWFIVPLKLFFFKSGMLCLRDWLSSAFMNMPGNHMTWTTKEIYNTLLIAPSYRIQASDYVRKNCVRQYFIITPFYDNN